MELNLFGSQSKKGGISKKISKLKGKGLVGFQIFSKRPTKPIAIFNPNLAPIFLKKSHC